MKSKRDYSSILPVSQRKLWSLFQRQAEALSRFGYYLAGGTALTLQIGHRRSVDFDFFSRRLGIARDTLNWINKFSNPVVREMDPNTLHLDIQGVKVSFIGAYKYRCVQKCVTQGKIPLAGMKDIGTMKLLAITHRAVLRDYVDLAAIIRNHIALSDLLKASLKKYGKSFNALIPLKALVSFEDLEPEMPHLFDLDLKKNWKKILIRAVQEITYNRQ